MQLKPIKKRAPAVLEPHISAIMSTPGQFITEAQLAEILDLSVKQAVIKAIQLRLSRIHVNKTRCYSKKQILAYLNNR